MNILVFDTETVDVEHAFCYNVGYTIVNIETREKLLKRDYVIEQVWENKMLFSTYHSFSPFFSLLFFSHLFVRPPVHQTFNKCFTIGCKYS